MSFAPADRPEETAEVATLRDLVRDVVPQWLETRRWFADKGRCIASVHVLDLYTEDVGEALLALAVIGVAFSDDGNAQYFLPLAMTAVPENAVVIAGASPNPSELVLVDATEMPWFGGWLLAAMGNGDASAKGAWVFEAAPDAAPLLARAQNKKGTLMRAEQSNSSLRFGEVLIVKLFRRLQPGLNPDEEALRGLATEHFSRVPSFAGSASWKSINGTYPIALAQGYIPNQGDGWSWTLERLAGGTPSETGDQAWSFEAEARLGVRTAELHLALSRVNDVDFTPIVAGEEFADKEQKRTRASLELVVHLLLDRKKELAEPLKSSLPEILDQVRNLSARTDGFQDCFGYPLIRVHGDYHLGQTLRTVDDDWTIIDFEGEPTRPISERRQRTSPLKDVAGMLRSYAYARGVAERAASVDGRPTQGFDTWERGARDAFLNGYRKTLRSEGATLVPTDDDAFRRALLAWELDKALYEIVYEVRNRPDWLHVPLRALLPGLVG